MDINNPKRYWGTLATLGGEQTRRSTIALIIVVATIIKPSFQGRKE